MKKIMSLGLFALTLSLMSVAPNPDTQEEFKRYPLVIVNCPSGYTGEYYDIGYSASDHADIASAICNDPQNQGIE